MLFPTIQKDWSGMVMHLRKQSIIYKAVIITASIELKFMPGNGCNSIDTIECIINNY